MARYASLGGLPRKTYFLPLAGFGGAPGLPAFAKGEAWTAAFGLSFLGFFASRFPRCSPLAIVISIVGC